MLMLIFLSIEKKIDTKNCQEKRSTSKLAQL